MKHFFYTIPGFFTQCFRQVYRDAVAHATYDRPHVFVEIGSFFGASTAYMAVEILNSGKDIKFHAVDSWEGDGDVSQYYSEKDVVYEKFLANVAPVRERIVVHRSLSVDAAEKFEDQSIVFCFIDAGHTYDSIIADLRAWLPKVKPGGLLAGHDYEPSFPGVIQAVNEIIGPRQITIQGVCWLYTVPSDIAEDEKTWTRKVLGAHAG